MLRHFVALTLGVLLIGSSSTAQTPQNFSGTWEIATDRSSVAEGIPTTLVITQTPKDLTIEERGNGQTGTITYPFRPTAEVIAGVATSGTAGTLAPKDAPPRTNAAVGTTGVVPDGPGGPTGLEAAGAEWRDGGLDTMIVAIISGKSVTQRTRRTLDATGTEMTVERVLAVQHGYQAGDASGSSRNVYVKRTPATSPK